MNTRSASLPHIVVIGAGFAGLNFCKRFPRGLASITVVDRTNHHLFQPLLFLIAFRNKLSVFTSWTYSYLTYKRGARVIYGGPPAQAGG